MIALGGGALLFLLHVPAILLAFRLIGGSSEVQTATAAYFGVRILSARHACQLRAHWLVHRARSGKSRAAAPAFPERDQIVLAIVFVLLAKGVAGAAMAAVCAEYAALAVGLFIAARLLRGTRGMQIGVFERQAFKRLIAVNADIMIRTICLVLAFTFFAAQGARLGDIALAANSVLRNLADFRPTCWMASLSPPRRWWARRWARRACGGSGRRFS